jgi:hypothetical protein
MGQTLLQKVWNAHTVRPLATRTDTTVHRPSPGTRSHQPSGIRHDSRPGLARALSTPHLRQQIGQIGILKALFLQEGRYKLTTGPHRCQSREISVQNRRISGPFIGWAIYRFEAPSFGAFWRLRRVKAKGKGRLRAAPGTDHDSLSS